jgi:hypothetical protein
METTRTCARCGKETTNAYTLGGRWLCGSCKRRAFILRDSICPVCDCSLYEGVCLNCEPDGLIAKSEQSVLAPEPGA